MNYTTPLWTAIFAHFALNEQLTRRKIFGIALALCGLYVLMGLQGVGDLTAAFIIIIGAIIMGISNVLVKLKLNGCNMIQLTTWQMIFGALSLIIYSTLIPQGEIDWCIPAVLCVLTGLAAAVAFFLWNYVLTHIEASTASIATLVIMGGVIILGEPFTVHIITGMLLIFAGILFVVKRGAKRL